VIKNVEKILLLSLIVTSLLSYRGLSNAESTLVFGGGSSSVDLDFRIQIQTVLFLELEISDVATEGVKLTVENPSGTGSIERNPNGGRKVSMQAVGIIPPGEIFTLSAYSAIALSDRTNSVPFDRIAWPAADFRSGAPDNHVNHRLFHFINSGGHEGTHILPYNNEIHHPTSICSRTVTYTLSSP
jgi:hypothetical protein